MQTLRSAAAMLTAALLLAGCSSKPEPVSEAETAVTEAVTEAVTTVTSEAASPETTTVTATVTAAVTTTAAPPRNPMTGEIGYPAEALIRRPAAVMVNNLTGSLPQYGIAAADQIYEIPVEGGITRLMAVYADYSDVPAVCSVRSCRYYFPLLCLGMDALYFHWGCDQTIALETLSRTGIDHFDGGALSGTLFFRDAERQETFAVEHTGCLDGSRIAAYLSSRSVRTELLPEYQHPAFHFAAEQINLTGGQPAAEITLHFSGSYYSTFLYSEESGTYNKLHSGSPHMDARTGTQLSFENVIILQTDIHTREDGYLMDVALSGGTGWYAANGSMVPLTWEKSAETAPIRLYDAAGAEMTVSPGKIYIGIIGTDCPVTF